MSYIQRAIEPVLWRATQEFPVVVLTGPRQAGKTTLFKQVFGKRYQYISLEPPDIQAAAKADPRGFLSLHEPPVIFDEVQYVPELLPYIKEYVDTHREKQGQYLLTGSQNLLLLEKITETLAGRAAFLKLFPLSYREISGRIEAVFPWDIHKISHHVEHTLSMKKLWQSFLRGNFPELVAHPSKDAQLWHASYIQAYLERDVRSLRQVGDLTQFQIFLRLLASRSAQLLNITQMAQDMGVAVNTLKAWISILEATYQIIILRPFYANIGKRLVKTPKIYFTDIGTLCYLVGLKDPEHAMASPMAGAIFETAILNEIYRGFTNQGIDPRLYFWRTSTGSEVDFVVEEDQVLIPIESKLSATPSSQMAKNILQFKEDFGKQAGKGFVIYNGNMKLTLGKEVMAWPFEDL